MSASGVPSGKAEKSDGAEGIGGEHCTMRAGGSLRELGFP
jgi:hypothetical protein